MHSRSPLNRQAPMISDNALTSATPKRKSPPVSRSRSHLLIRGSFIGSTGVEPDHAERALGHVIGGVRGTYDRHAFREEKSRAFIALEAQIALILSPSASVIRLRGR